MHTNNHNLKPIIQYNVLNKFLDRLKHTKNEPLLTANKASKQKNEN